MHPGRVLRDLMKKEKNVMMVGAFNGLIGRILKAKGKYFNLILNLFVCLSNFSFNFLNFQGLSLLTSPEQLLPAPLDNQILVSIQ